MRQTVSFRDYHFDLGHPRPLVRGQAPDMDRKTATLRHDSKERTHLLLRPTPIADSENLAAKCRRGIASLSTAVSLALACVLLLGVLSTQSQARQPARVEILFMNHGPMQPTLRTLKSLLGRYSGKVQAYWFDFEAKSGADFMRAKGISAHIPLLIFINGAHTFDVAGRRVTFMGFPSGSGPYQFQGKWTFQDLEQVLQSVSR